jgi:putrescine transport system ATP-binding protein
LQRNPASAPQEPLIRIADVSKSFGAFTAVDGVSLEIAQGELFALLGGSGCGKTTLLRMLAGFEAPTSGRILIDGQDMAGIPPYERPVNMMFQSYALFPHMTVEANVGYGLKHEAMTAEQRRARVAEMLDLVQLSPFAGRKPHQLSGGQRQRVALARALDKKLREHTQFEIKNIQAKTGITFVVVTHDQEEAMTLASRIAVMDRGKIRQTGRPAEVYERPASRFVADFIGSINMFEGEVRKSEGGRLSVHIPEADAELTAADAASLAPGTRVTLALRPEKITLSAKRPPAGQNALRGRITDRAYFGKDSLYRVALASGRLVLVSNLNATRDAAGEDGAQPDVWLAFDPAAAIILVA